MTSDAAYSLLVTVAQGEREEAFECLEKALADKETGMMLFKHDPGLDPLRDDQRFEALLEGMNLR